MGVGKNRLVLFEHEGAAWVRAAGTWERMPWHLQAAYRIAGRDAQHAFWGQGGDERDEVGEGLSGPAKAIVQANILAAELRKAGEFCRSTRSEVMDENDQRIFERRPAETVSEGSPRAS